MPPRGKTETHDLSIGRTTGRIGRSSPATGRVDLSALREAVAAIEGSRVERLETPPSSGIRRRARAEGSAAEGPGMAEAVLAGLPPAGLTEIHVDETRGAGPGAGFVLALACRLGASARHPLLWVGQSLAFRESGRFYAPGLAAFGFDPGALLLVATRREEEALWVAEEAGRSGVPAAVVLEVRGNPARLSLEGTRRLHVRSREAGVPLLLLRQAGRAEPTAAPLRLRVRAAAAAPAAGIEAREGGSARLIGHPLFCVVVEKSRDGRARRFLLEWNPHDRRLENAAAQDRPVDVGKPGAAFPGARLSQAVHGPGPAREARPVLAFPEPAERAGGACAAGAF